MSIRSGGRPRGERPPPRYDPDAYATESIPRFSEPNPRNGRNGRGRGGGGGVPGFIKFLVFAGVLAGFVIVVGLTALRPLVNNALVRWASDSPGALSIGFVRDAVRDDLGTALTSAPPGASDEQVTFVINQGDNATTIARRLEREDFLIDSRAFVYIATERELTGSLRSGEFILRRSLTPDELVTSLLDPQQLPFVDIELRTQLRLEQITAKLLTIDGLSMDVEEFYELASDPSRELLADYPWLRTALAGAPEGVEPSLEGFLWPGTYRVLPDTSGEELIRLMLDAFIEEVGEDRLTVPDERGLTFYQVLTLASIVEREAVLSEEKPKIAGVYENRLDGISGVKNKLLNADPTVIYAADTVALAEQPLEDWVNYRFWTVPEAAMADVALPPELEAFNTYRQAGLVPWPICTPTAASIDAALAPDTADKYIYFLAIPDGDGAHAFAKTAAEHRENREKYGYN
ncbi:MAG TPA: endolytic transglycosylase MltG [Clostridia bacterium]|nr:endolytic transglycosylase MltG [Clostridia bacterium]